MAKGTNINDLGKYFKYLKAKEKSRKFNKTDMDTHLRENPETMFALEDYTRGKHKNINKALRGEGDDFSKMRGKEDNDKLKGLFENTKGNFEGTSYRGTKLPREKLKGLKEGDIIENQAYLSTSKDPKIAKSFRKESDKVDKGVDMEIDAWDKPGYDVEKHSSIPWEREVIIPPKNYLRVTGKKMGHGLRGDYEKIKTQLLSDKEFKALSKVEKDKVITNLMGSGVGLGALEGNMGKEEEEVKPKYRKRLSDYPDGDGDDPQGMETMLPIVGGPLKSLAEKASDFGMEAVGAGVEAAYGTKYGRKIGDAILGGVQTASEKAQEFYDDVSNMDLDTFIEQMSTKGN